MKYFLLTLALLITSLTPHSFVHAGTISGVTFATTSISNAECNASGTFRGSAIRNSAYECELYCATSFSAPLPNCCTIQSNDVVDLGGTNNLIESHTKTCTARVITSGATTTAKSAAAPVRSPIASSSSPYWTSFTQTAINNSAFTNGQPLRNHMLANGLTAADISGIGFFSDGIGSFWDQLHTNHVICNALKPNSQTVDRGGSLKYSSPENNFIAYNNGTVWSRHRGNNNNAIFPGEWHLNGVQCTSIQELNQSWQARTIMYDNSSVTTSLVANPASVNGAGNTSITWVGNGAATCTITNVTSGAVLLGPVDPTTISPKILNPVYIDKTTNFRIDCTKNQITSTSFLTVPRTDLLNVSCSAAGGTPVGGVPNTHTIGEQIQWFSEVSGALRPYTYTWVPVGATENQVTGNTPTVNKTYTTTGADKQAHLVVTSTAFTGTGQVTESYATVSPFETGMCGQGSLTSSGTTTLPIGMSELSARSYANNLCDQNSSPGQCCDATVAHSTVNASTTFAYRVYQPVDVVSNTKPCPANSLCEFYAGTKTSGAPVPVPGLTGPFPAQTISVVCAMPGHVPYPNTCSTQGYPLNCQCNGGFGAGCSIEAKLGTDHDVAAVGPVSANPTSPAAPGTTIFSGTIKNVGNSTFFPSSFTSYFTIDIGNNGTIDTNLAIPSSKSANYYSQLEVNKTFAGGTVRVASNYNSCIHSFDEIAKWRCDTNIGTSCRAFDDETDTGCVKDYWVFTGGTTGLSNASAPCGTTRNCVARSPQDAGPQLWPTQSITAKSIGWTSVAGVHKVCLVANVGNGLLESSDKLANNQGPCFLYTVGGNPITSVALNANVGGALNRVLKPSNTDTPENNYIRSRDVINFSWTCTGATTCTLRGPSGQLATGGASGSFTTGAITASGTYTLTATNGNYTVVRVMNIKVAPRFYEI